MYSSWYSSSLNWLCLQAILVACFLVYPTCLLCQHFNLSFTLTPYCLGILSPSSSPGKFSTLGKVTCVYWTPASEEVNVAGGKTTHCALNLWPQITHGDSALPKIPLNFLVNVLSPLCNDYFISLPYS